ncbi:hypothetical protein [Haladaptatus sp. NG-WS-4]
MAVSTIMSPYQSSLEYVVVKAITYTMAPFVILTIGFALLFRGRFSEARGWFTGDWRVPL